MCEYIIVEDFNMDKHIFNEDTTMNIYAHATRESKRTSARLLDAA